MKRNVTRGKNPFRQVIGNSFTIFVFSVAQSVALALSLPYSVYRVVVPRKPGRRPETPFFKRYLRKILEFKRSRQIVGVNLATALFLSSVVPLPFAAHGVVAGVSTESDKIVAEVSLNTESTFRAPVPGYVSQGYSWYHRGIDFAGNDNSLIYPIAEGKVVEIEYAPFGYGLSVVVDHGNSFLSRYAHMQKINVALNQMVDKGTSLGHVGSTGWSTGPHLHLEVYQSGSTVNPFAYIPREYEEDLKPSKTQAVIAVDREDIAVKEAAVEAMSVQVAFKENAEDFVDPNDVAQPVSVEAEE